MKHRNVFLRKWIWFKGKKGATQVTAGEENRQSKNCHCSFQRSSQEPQTTLSAAWGQAARGTVVYADALGASLLSAAPFAILLVSHTALYVLLSLPSGACTRQFLRPWPACRVHSLRCGSAHLMLSSPYRPSGSWVPRDMWRKCGSELC